MRRSFTVRRLRDKRAKPSLDSLSRKSTLSQTCTQTHRKTHTTIQRRGVWDIPQTASCSCWMALVSQRTIWVLLGLATCVGSECLPDWLVASGFCVLFWECLSLLPSLLLLSLTPSLLSFSSSQVVCRGCPGNLAGCPTDSPPPPPGPHTHPLSLQDGPPEIISPLSDTLAGHSLTCTDFTYTQWHLKQTR